MLRVLVPSSQQMFSPCHLGQSPLAKITMTSPPSGPAQDAFCPKHLPGGTMSLPVGPFLDSEDAFSFTVSFDFSIISISANDGGFPSTFHGHCPRLPESLGSSLPSQLGALAPKHFLFQSLCCSLSCLKQPEAELCLHGQPLTSAAGELNSPGCI